MFNELECPKCWNWYCRKVVTNSHAEAGAPSGVSAALDGTTITVTWTPPSPAPSNGYTVYYTDSYSPKFRLVSRDAGSVSVSSGSDSQVVIIPDTDIAYRASVVAVSDLPSVEVTAVPGTPRYVTIIHDFVSVPVILLHASLQIPMLRSLMTCCCQTTVLWKTLSCACAVLLEGWTAAQILAQVLILTLLS